MKTMKRVGLIGVLAMAGVTANASELTDAEITPEQVTKLNYTETDSEKLTFVHRRSFRHSHRRGFRSRGFSRGFGSHGRRRQHFGSRHYYGPRRYYGSRHGYYSGHRFGYSGRFNRFGHGFH